MEMVTMTNYTAQEKQKQLITNRLNPFHILLAYSVSLTPASVPASKANIISGTLVT